MQGGCERREGRFGAPLRPLAQPAAARCYGAWQLLAKLRWRAVGGLAGLCRSWSTQCAWRRLPRPPQRAGLSWVGPGGMGALALCYRCPSDRAAMHNAAAGAGGAAERVGLAPLVVEPLGARKRTWLLRPTPASTRSRARSQRNYRERACMQAHLAPKPERLAARPAASERLRHIPTCASLLHCPAGPPQHQFSISAGRLGRLQEEPTAALGACRSLDGTGKPPPPLACCRQSAVGSLHSLSRSSSGARSSSSSRPSR